MSIRRCLWVWVLVLPLQPFGALASPLSLGFEANYPLGAGFHLEIKKPESPLLLSFRVIPTFSSFIESANSAAVGWGFYNDAVAEIVSETAGGAAFYELDLGYAIGGWRLALGASYIRGRGEVLGTTLNEAVSGLNIGSGYENSKFEIDCELINTVLRLERNFRLGGGFFLLAGGGILKPFDSTTRTNHESLGDVVMLVISNRVDAYLDDVFSEDVWVPFMNISIQRNF